MVCSRVVVRLLFFITGDAVFVFSNGIESGRDDVII
jgi:hypothetical protein